MPSAGMSPTQADVMAVDLGLDHGAEQRRAELADDMDGPGSRLEHREDGPARVAQGPVAGLRHPGVVEHGPGDGGMTVGEAELAEAAGRVVLEPAEVFDLQLDERGLVVLGRVAPRGERVEERGRDVLVEVELLQRVVLEEIVPVEVGPPLRLHEVRGVGYRLRAELGDEAGEARHRPECRCQTVHPAVVPAEVEVRVGAAAPEAGQDAGVRDSPGASGRPCATRG